jgi:hypothetical protein
MERIIVDAALPERLKSFVRPVELCDADGTVLGRYTPDAAQFDNLDPGVTAEELDRRANEPGGRSLVDILADLEKRG